MRKVLALLAVAGLAFANSDEFGDDLLASNIMRSSRNNTHVRKSLIKPHPETHIAVEPIIKPIKLRPLPKDQRSHQNTTNTTHPVHPTHSNSRMLIGQDMYTQANKYHLRIPDLFMNHPEFFKEKRRNELAQNILMDDNDDEFFAFNDLGDDFLASNIMRSSKNNTHIRKSLIKPHPEAHIAVEPIIKPIKLRPLPKDQHSRQNTTNTTHPVHPIHSNSRMLTQLDKSQKAQFEAVKDYLKKNQHLVRDAPRIEQPKIVPMDDNDDEFVAFDGFGDDDFFAADDDELFIENDNELAVTNVGHALGDSLVKGGKFNQKIHDLFGSSRGAYF